jgi:hypothetical protein
MSDKKSGCGCLGVFVVGFLFVWAIFFFGGMGNFFLLTKTNISAATKICGGEIEQNIVDISSKELLIDSSTKGGYVTQYYVFTTSDGSKMEIFSGSCNADQTAKLKGQIKDRKSAFDEIRDGQPHLIFYVEDGLYGQTVTKVTRAIPLTLEQARILNEILKEQENITSKQLDEILIQH